jgi:hypothetical protein
MPVNIPNLYTTLSLRRGQGEVFWIRAPLSFELFSPKVMLSRSAMANTSKYTGTAEYTSSAFGTFSPHPAVGHLLLLKRRREVAFLLSWRRTAGYIIFWKRITDNTYSQSKV